jgi:quinol monooxygenase YgiN
MFIIAGHIEVGSQRDAFIAEHIDDIKTSQAEDGCVEYVMSADPIESGRVRVFEMWESEAQHDAHVKRMTAPRPDDAPARIPFQSLEVVYYEVGGILRRVSR